MRYTLNEIHTLTLLSDEASDQERFHVPPDLRIMAWSMGLLVLALLAAAALLEVDKVVPASGVFETELGLFSVRNMQSGHVKSVHVREGEAVRSGQVLVEFDTRMIDLEISRIRHDMQMQAESLWSDIELVQGVLGPAGKDALLNKAEIVPRPPLAEELKSRLGHQLKSMTHVYASGQRSASERATELAEQIRLVRETVRSLRSDVDQSIQLVADGFESPASLANKQRQLLELLARERGLRNDLQSLKGEASKLSAESERQLNEITTERLRSIDQAIIGYQRSALQLESQTRLRQRLHVEAPFDGIVDRIRLRGAQEYVAENVELMTIRKETSREGLEIDILMPSALAVWVQPGMPFRASADGNNPEDHGHVRGVITFVSNSSESGAGDPSNARLFRLRGRIEEYRLKSRASADTFARPGMALRVDVITGKRSLLSYILDPFEKTLREAAREPS